MWLLDAARRIPSREPVLYLTNEQTPASLYLRLANRYGMTIADVMKDKLNNIIINDCAGYTAERLLSSLAQIMQDDTAPRIIIIDWLQMIASEAANPAEWYRVRGLISELNALCLAHGGTIIAAAQLNRQAINPARLQLSSIGDSIGISQLAAKVIGLWNTNKPAQWGGKGAFDSEKGKSISCPGLVDGTTPGGLYIRVLKERHGRRLYPATLTLAQRQGLVGGNGPTDSGTELVPDIEGAASATPDPKPKKPGKRPAPDTDPIL